MTTTGKILFLIIIVALALGGWFIWRTPAVAPIDTNNDGVIDERDEQPDEEGQNNNQLVTIHEDVKMLTPRASQAVGSPLVVKGEAKTWYFEGSFPVKLISPSGKVLAIAPAQAQGEWMTTNFVPFEATLEFISTEEGMGKLVLQKDNPSDMRELDENVEIPVRFTKTETMSVKAYFSPADIGDNCSLVNPVTRTVPKTLATAQAAINELLKGPTSAEASLYATNIPAGTVLQKIEIRSGTAYADFNSALEQGGGSCSMAARSAQITQTLKQFPTIKNVVISINGRTEDILQP